MIAVKDIPRDRTLPQLTTALDLAAMQAIFQETVFAQPAGGGPAGPRANSLQIREGRIERIKYKPGQNCLICYRLEIFNPVTQETGQQILCARIYEPGGAYARFVKACRQPLVQPRFGRAVTHIPGLEMVVWAFPNDRKLDGLPKLVDRTCLKDELIPGVIAANFASGWHMADLAHELVHYVPEHTCTIRVNLQLHHQQTGEKQALTLYGKTYYNHDGAETYRLMRQLWTSQARQGGQLQLAPPLAYHPDYKILWQSGLPGQTLLEQEMGSSHFLTLLSQAATTVAALHQAPVFCDRSIHFFDWVAKLKEMRHLLAQVRPSCQQHLDILIDRLLSQAEQLGPQPAAALHGDLHLKNFFVDGAQVALIDLDNLCYGSPWHDIGSFIAGIFYRGLLMKMPEAEIWRMTEVFCRQYQQNVPWQVSGFVLNWYIAAALINERAFRCTTRLKGRLDILDDLIKLAGKISLVDDLPGSDEHN